jgi:cytochrome c-type biogenesis protein CcmH/NrfG
VLRMAGLEAHLRQLKVEQMTDKARDTLRQRAEDGRGNYQMGQHTTDETIYT